jgi:4-phospho-D-threonate 3-dehydrogenase / 4-phospho-D-erythronate 3-dehydrogenase
MRDERPLVGITMGDPTGVGPEIVVGALATGELQRECQPLVIGRAAVLAQAATLMRCTVDILAVDTIEQALEKLATQSDGPPSILCLQTGSDDVEPMVFEQMVAPKLAQRIDARGGQAAYDYLVRATEMCLAGELDAMVTCPLHKTALQNAGHGWPGHTELLAHLCGVTESAMMLYLPPGRPRHGGPLGLGVVHVTLHCALRDVFHQLTIPHILETIELADSFFRGLRSTMGLPGAPRIAVAALNPHGGENGRFGDEESTIIRPAVEQAIAQGIDAGGPFPVDSLMPAAADGEYDAVVAMYHDQGHIALKLLDMFEAVNITLGLPIVRTSVAHGTAHDIAWQGKAKSGGMKQSILTAARLARAQRLAIRDP